MPAATSKSELLAVTIHEWSRLETLLDSVPAEDAMRKDANDTSIKDIVGHRAHWIGLFLGWYVDGQAGREVAFPAPGYKWSDLKAYNADVRRVQAALGWEEARALLREYHEQLVAFVQVRSEQELYGGPMKGARNDWTTGRWAEAAGASHYRSAIRAIRAMRREMV